MLISFISRTVLIDCFSFLNGDGSEKIKPSLNQVAFPPLLSLPLSFYAEADSRIIPSRNRSEEVVSTVSLDLDSGFVLSKPESSSTPRRELRTVLLSLKT